MGGPRPSVPRWSSRAGPAMTVCAAPLLRAADPGCAEDDPLAEGTERDAAVRAGVSPSDVDTLLHLAGGRVGGGQFGVNTAGRLGAAMRRAPTTVGWF